MTPQGRPPPLRVLSRDEGFVSSIPGNDAGRSKVMKNEHKDRVKRKVKLGTHITATHGSQQGRTDRKSERSGHNYLTLGK